jgi:dipeptidyl aminopeptidase/acylaminoacyl peptidase
VVRTTPDGGSAFLSGTQYFEDPMEDAPRPFLDRVDLRSGETERLFQSGEDLHASVEAIVDPEARQLVVTRQSATTVPDSWLVDRESGEETRLTSNVDHTPDITEARRETIMVERPDGFTSMVEVTFPVDWEAGSPAPPAMFWFYPREYTGQEDYEASAVDRYNKNLFPRLRTRSMEFLTRLGYAVVDPDLPIVGESGQMNDNYVQDLRNTLSTVIDSLDARGWADRARLGLGGHSYGAFGTANAMVNTPFFKAGIAGDGNYNRSLTPAGFQREPRVLWEAEQIYIEMSPFFFADRLTGALLLYHGMDDHNVGTHPTHSKRLFHALNVLGKTAALYMYPHEDHGPVARETTLDLWARWTAWLETHVKNAGGDGGGAVTDDGAAQGGR